MTGRGIVLTGATGGLGRALVAQLSKPGATLLLCGRNEERLSSIAALARRQGAEVVTLRTDLMRNTGRAIFDAAIRDFDRQHPVDLLLANAGVKTGNQAGIEAKGQTERIVAVNLTAVIACTQAILPAMRLRAHGRIGLIGSIAGLSPQPDLLSYSATKAAVAAYATALRRELRGSGVGVSLVLPGFVDTPMTHRHHGPTPLLMSAETAALAIVRGLERRRNVIAVPQSLRLLVALSNALPMALSDRIDRMFRARIEPDSDEMGDTTPPSA